MGCHAALEELGADYALRFVDFEQPWPRDDLALNPHRKVPTLLDRLAAGEPGAVVYQSAAILLYLAEQHPEAGLMPEPGSPDRGRCYQWLFFMAEMLQPSFQMYYYPERHTTKEDPASRQAVQAKGLEWIAELWGRIDEALGATEGSPWFLGEDISLCDFYALPMLVWNENNQNFPALDGFSNVAGLLAALRERPSVRHVLKTHVGPGLRTVARHPKLEERRVVPAPGLEPGRPFRASGF